MSVTREFPPYAWPGGYPIIYIDKDGCDLCDICAAADFESDGSVATPHTFFEGEPIHCEGCNTRIESAYGDPTTRSA